MRFMSIASGSSGNCVYAGSDKTHILIDTGIPCKRVLKGLAKAGLTGKDISGILITHEHTDHIQGLGVFLRKFPVPVYASKETIKEILQNDKLGKMPADCFQVIDTAEFSIGDVQVRAMPVSHDAANPLCYRMSAQGHCAAVVTDLGAYNEQLVEGLQNLDILLVEANHDIRMLEAGPYPYHLKRRILSNEGHLSNESCGRFLNHLLHDHLQQVFLGHLSAHNNLPELAAKSVQMEIDMGFSKYKGKDFPITIARRDAPSEIVELA